LHNVFSARSGRSWPADFRLSEHIPASLPAPVEGLAERFFACPFGCLLHGFPDRATERSDRFDSDPTFFVCYPPCASFWE
jgi:hypothetical protein